MSIVGINLLKLYIPLIAWVGLGIILGHRLPPIVPVYLGKFLFWIGVPISIVTFLRQANLSESVWVAPLVAWMAIGLGAGLGWLWIRAQAWLEPFRHKRSLLQHIALHLPLYCTAKPSQGSFLLSTMIGNTGYLGYPVILTLVGSHYFAWALFYDTLGTTLGAYSVGIALAARFGLGSQSYWQLLQAMVSNPGFSSFVIGLGFRSVPLPAAIEQGLLQIAWAMLALSLLLMGMRLSQIASWRSVKQAAISLAIKMMVVPLFLGVALPYWGITGAPQLVIVLQMAMPPAFATLIIAEAYDLDRELTVTTLALGSGVVLLTLPVWMQLFSLTE